MEKKDFILASASPYRLALLEQVALCPKLVCPADIDEETDKKLRDAATEAYEALHLESYARIDFLLDKGGFTYCLEANTLPGMTPTSLLPQEAAVEGISYPDLCEKIIEISLAKYPKEKSDF